MNILVTGATGFIGRHLVAKLSAFKEYKIFCLVRNKNRAKCLLPFKPELVYADITDRESLKKFLASKIEVVFHCAGYVNTANKDRELLHQINVIGTENVCWLSMQLGIKHMVYLSSIAVISGNEQVPLNDDLPYSATNIYGESKIEAEKKVLAFRDKGLRVVIIRPCMVYGEDEPHLMGKLLFLIKHRLIFLIDNGQNKFHLVYVKNLVELMIFSLGNEEFFKGSFLIADKEVLTTKEVFAIFAKTIGAKLPLKLPGFFKPILVNLPYLGARLKVFLKDRVYSIERVKVLGFKHPYSAGSSLRKSSFVLYHKQD